MANLNTNKQDRFAIFATNKATKFTPFSLRLSNGATLTGIYHIPSSGLLHGVANKPLLVGIHGATCTAHTWDVNPEYTASIYSDLLGVPFVAFNRPNFLGSSGWLVDNAPDAPEKNRFAVPEGTSFFCEEARWYHQYILPALWTAFGLPNACSSLVTTSHSMAVPPTVIAAGLYADQQKDSSLGGPPFPWAGIILTSFGEARLEVSTVAANVLATNPAPISDRPLGHDPSLHIGPYPKSEKCALMLGPDGCCEPKLHDLCWRQNAPFFLIEVVEMGSVWVARKEDFKAKVRIPVLYGLGNMEWLWQYGREHVDMFTKGFVNAPRVEGAVVAGAPHAIEWSPVGKGWWVKTFGWAIEVSASQAQAAKELKGFV